MHKYLVVALVIGVIILSPLHVDARGPGGGAARRGAGGAGRPGAGVGGVGGVGRPGTGVGGVGQRGTSPATRPVNTPGSLQRTPALSRAALTYSTPSYVAPAYGAPVYVAPYYYEEDLQRLRQ